MTKEDERSLGRKPDLLSQHPELEELLGAYKKASEAPIPPSQGRIDLLLTPLREMRDKVSKRIDSKHITPYDAFLLASLEWDDDSLINISKGTVAGLRSLLRENVLEPAGRLEKMIRYINENQGTPIVVKTGLEFGRLAAGRAGSLELRFHRQRSLPIGGAKDTWIYFFTP